MIRRFGILNTLISPDDPEQAAGRSFYGVPFPGVYVTDENGVVTENTIIAIQKLCAHSAYVNYCQRMTIWGNLPRDASKSTHF